MRHSYENNLAKRDHSYHNLLQYTGADCGVITAYNKMPHISNKKLNPRLSEKLFGKLLAVFDRAQNKEHLSLVVNELFTPTEKIMLAKRIAVILMLDNNIPHHRITELLKMSPTTVVKVSLGIEQGKYDTILEISKREKTDMTKLVWNILTVGGIMPPKVGRKYWRGHLHN